MAIKGENEKKLAGKVALITGAGGTIGRAIALLFAEEGADIAVNDVNLSSAQTTAAAVRQIGQRAIAIRADVAQADDVDAMVDKVVSELGGVHILVNNAGLPQQELPTVEQSVEQWEKIVAVILRGTYLCSRRTGQWMVKHNGGKILNIASVVGMGGYSTNTAYGSAKAGVINMTQTLAAEWGRYNINVNSISPTFVWSALMESAIRHTELSLDKIKKRIPLGRLALPDDVAKAALYLVSDDARYVTGANLPVDGGWTAE
jgi:NAD(P)-dependent dehydrogenase (short-subunit alcohol dehydrogenase family)